MFNVPHEMMAAGSCRDFNLLFVMAAAMGERQMLPEQTNTIRFTPPPESLGKSPATHLDRIARPRVSGRLR